MTSRRVKIRSGQNKFAWFPLPEAPAIVDDGDLRKLTLELKSADAWCRGNPRGAAGIIHFAWKFSGSGDKAAVGNLSRGVHRSCQTLSVCRRVSPRRRFAYSEQRCYTVAIMAPYRRANNTIAFSCDAGCGFQCRTAEISFRCATQMLLQRGWSVKQRHNRWVHHCPTCTEVIREGRPVICQLDLWSKAS